MTGPGIRSFVAVPLPESVRAGILAAAGELARELPSVRWSKKVENLHVTLKFLGRVAEDRLGEMGSALERAVGALPRFGVEMRGLGAFPSPRQARVIWAGVVDPDRRLAQVAEAIETAAAALGIADKEARLFRPHVTVGRAKAGVDARAALAPFADRPFGSVPVDEVQLFESQLGGGPDNAGSTYVLRSRAALNSN
jgi:2'-5' RNA ligase